MLPIEQKSLETSRFMSLDGGVIHEVGRNGSYVCAPIGIPSAIHDAHNILKFDNEL